MRIGIDARELCGHATGAGRYLGGLLREWSGGHESAGGHTFVLYTPERLALPFDAGRFEIRLVAGGGAGTWWEQGPLAAAARRDRLDLFFGPAYSAPLRLTTPLALAIHDVSFFARPEWFRPREGFRRRFVTRRAARRARAILTISDFSRREILARLGVPPVQVHVVPPGVTGVSPEHRSSSIEERILFVGSVFNRRHVPDLIQAFARLAARRPLASLDLVGDNRTYPVVDLPRVIEATGLGARIRWHQYASEAELAELYARARAFAFLSEYEGLGLTPLEALTAGVPPVLLDTPVARESCGEAALYVSTGDVDSAAAALEELLVNEQTRARLLGAAGPSLARYQWDRAARDTLRVLEAAAAPVVPP
jgi:glycosyltransferase involved in cell wall biosynthesis